MSGFDVNYTINLEDGLKAYDIHDQVMEDCRNRGLHIPAIPLYLDPGSRQTKEYRGEIPSDVTSLTDQELGWYMSMMTEWIGYVSGQKAVADLAREEAAEKLDLVEARIRLTYKEDEHGKRRTNPERDDLVKTDRRYVEARRSHMYLEAYSKIIQTVLKKAERNYNTISRRITQRGQEIDRNNRTNNVGNIPSGQPFIPRR